jgi:FAD/FMN-containing dehydrogenase
VTIETTNGSHERRVDAVVRQLRSLVPGTPVSLKKRAVSHLVPKLHDRRYTDRKVDLSSLDHILEIDPDARTCTAEPGVTFEDLVRATLAHGLVPTVVPELKTITVGGAVSGCSIESASFRHGGFHDSCLAYEVITARGEVIHCTPDDRPLVFQMMHGSFGTLGILSKLVFRLVPAKPFVHLRYETYPTTASFREAIARHYRADDVDFMDGIIHSPERHVLAVGEFVDRAPYTNRYDWVTVYYKTTAERREDYFQTPDYFFRYDHGVTNVHPRSAVGRFFLGKFLHSGRVLKIAEKFRSVFLSGRPEVTVDMFLPVSRLEEYMRWHEAKLAFFPLWCVPYKRVRDYEWIAEDYLRDIDDDLFIDLAIYGMEQPDGRNVYGEIEDELYTLRGIKTLISHNYYDEERFWRIWNRPNYLAVKALTDPDNLLRDLYDKTCRASRGLERSAE